MSPNAYEVQMVGGPIDGELMVLPIFDQDPYDGQWPIIVAYTPLVVGDSPADLEVKVVELQYKVEPNPADDGPLFIAKFKADLA